MSQSIHTPIKTIEVTGESKRSTTPDEITFTITMEEYWKEEFEGKKHEEYKTKIEIIDIENSLIKELQALDISMEQITLKQAGNYWRQRGKDFLISKTLEVKLEDFSKANEIANTVVTRGVRNMNVSGLDHKDLETIKLGVKSDAVRAAKEKAEKLASALGKKIVDVISIVEVDQYANASPRPQVAYSRSSAMLKSSDSGAAYENFRKLETKAVVRCVFEMV